MDLRFVGDPAPILTRLSRGDLDDPDEFARMRAAVEADTRTDLERLRCAADGRVTLFPHQERAVRRAIRELRGRALLADEVGLGKTIEAGMILKEYMLRGLARRALILVPPGLLGNWRGELERLGVSPRSDPEPEGGARGVWLVSLARARMEPLASRLASRAWDVVIVDEAHRLRTSSSRSWQLVNRLQSRFLLLLTATPVQNELRELYTLVTLLKPGQLSTYGAFRRRFMLDRHGVRDPERLRDLLAEVMIRTTRREALLPFPRRHLTVLEAPLSSVEREAYGATLALAREAYRRLGEEGVHLLPYLQLLRQAASHPRAGLPTLRKLLDTAGGWPSRQRVEGVAQALGRVPDPTGRMVTLGKWLSGLPRSEKVIIFTEFRRVQRLLGRWLTDQGWTCCFVHGGQDRESREANIREFRGPAQILLCTDVGSEGHNWQWARTVVNFDLPWNPMRIEQRIGRVYRLGQQRDVRVVHVVAPGTVEAYVLDLLHRKLGMFEQVIGDLDDVLGMEGEGWRRRLVDVILGAEDPGDEGRRFAALGEEVAAWRSAAESALRWDWTRGVG